MGSVTKSISCLVPKTLPDDNFRYLAAKHDGSMF